MQLVIRQYHPADKDAVLNLFCIGTWEHARPCFHNAMTSPLYVAITLALGVAGYLLGSVFGAVLFPAAWAGLIYYCCQELYAKYVRERLRTDMQDIPGNFLSRPDDCFWVAEAESEGRTQIMGRHGRRIRICDLDFMPDALPDATLPISQAWDQN